MFFLFFQIDWFTIAFTSANGAMQCSLACWSKICSPCRPFRCIVVYKVSLSLCNLFFNTFSYLHHSLLRRYYYDFTLPFSLLLLLRIMMMMIIIIICLSSAYDLLMCLCSRCLDLPTKALRRAPGTLEWPTFEIIPTLLNCSGYHVKIPWIWCRKVVRKGEVQHSLQSKA